MNKLHVQLGNKIKTDDLVTMIRPRKTITNVPINTKNVKALSLISFKHLKRAETPN